MTKEELNYIKDSFSQIIDDIAGNPEWYEASRAIASELGSLERELEKKVVELPSGLDEAANKFAVFYDQGTCDGIAQDCFKAGAKWQKAQMMKDAVEADVNTYKELPVGKSWAEFVVEMPTSNLGDKVRLIVLPMEEIV